MLRNMIYAGARTRFGAVRAIFSLRVFVVYQTGHFASSIGFWMQRLAVGWTIWELTGSEAWLGLVAFAELFPSILTGIWGGALVDRSSSVRVMFLGSVAVTLASLSLALFEAAALLTPWLVLTHMLVIGAMTGLVLPARLAMASHLAPPDLLPVALAVNSTGFNLSRFLGPAIAAAMMIVGSVTLVLVVSVVLYVLFVICLFTLRNTPHSADRMPGTATIGTIGARTGDTVSTRSAILSIVALPLILAAILIQAVQGLFLRPASELFPAFAEVVFDMGVNGLGLLNAALGVGAVMGALMFPSIRSSRQAMHQMILGTVAFATTLLFFSVTTWFPLVLFILVLHGAAMTVSNIVAMSFVQLSTPRDRLGRVLSVYALVFRAGPAVGAVVFGFGAEHSGLATAGVMAAVLGLLSTALIYALIIRPNVRNDAGLNGVN
jgi:predicted MFS family arabinose efflux permease